MSDPCAEKQAAVLDSPDDPDALLALGRCQVEADRTQDAAATLRRLLELDPRNSVAAALFPGMQLRLG